MEEEIIARLYNLSKNCLISKLLANVKSVQRYLQYEQNPEKKNLRKNFYC